MPPSCSTRLCSFLAIKLNLRQRIITAVERRLLQQDSRHWLHRPVCAARAMPEQHTQPCSALYCGTVQRCSSCYCCTVRPHRQYLTLEGLSKGSSFTSGQLPEGETLPSLSLTLTVPRSHCSSSVGHMGITSGRELRPVGLAVTYNYV